MKFVLRSLSSAKRTYYTDSTDLHIDMLGILVVGDPMPTHIFYSKNVNYMAEPNNAHKVNQIMFGTLNI